MLLPWQYSYPHGVKQLLREKKKVVSKAMFNTGLQKVRAKIKIYITWSDNLIYNDCSITFVITLLLDFKKSILQLQFELISINTFDIKIFLNFCKTRVWAKKKYQCKLLLYHNKMEKLFFIIFLLICHSNIYLSIQKYSGKQ